MTAHRPVTEADLHAYLDGALPPAEAARVAEWLGAHEEEDARVRAWRDDAALLRDAYAEVAVPRFPALAAQRRRIGWAAAAGIALLAFGLGTGAGLLVAAADAQPEGDYTIITRDDGTRQWAYKGKPLYLWVKDAKAGDVTGDNVNNVWHVAKP